MAEPRIAICVVTYNSADLIRDFASALPEGAAGTRWTLVVADNASQDDTLAQVTRWAPEAVVVETGANLGYAGGVNAAVRAAGEHDAYLIVNTDVRLGAGLRIDAVAALRPGAGIVVPQLLDERGELIWSMRREPSVCRALGGRRPGRTRGPACRIGRSGDRSHLYTSARPVDWAEGSTQLIGADCWRECGQWDESCSSTRRRPNTTCAPATTAS